MIMKRKQRNGQANIFGTRKLPLQDIVELGDKQYEQAMKHVNKIKKLQQQKKSYVEPLDPECTFQPKLYTQSYKTIQKVNGNRISRIQKPEERLIEWGKTKQKKHVQKVLSGSVELETKVIRDLKCSIEKHKTPKYLQKYLQSKTMIFSDAREQNSSRGKQRLEKKQLSETTLFSEKKKPLSFLYA